MVLSWSFITAIELQLRDGSVIVGDPICESKSTLVLKEGAGTVSLFKKTIASVDSVSLDGRRYACQR